MSHPTGSKRLDQLLDGGIPSRGRALIFGPSFQGKEILAKQTAISTLLAGQPVVFVLTNSTAIDTIEAMIKMDPEVVSAIDDGTLLFVDTYATSLGVSDPHPNVEYVESSLDLNGITMALNRQQGRILGEHEEHLVIFDSASTLVLYSNAQSTFRFLQILVGKARQVGAATMILLDDGMHSEPEVQMFRHMCDGAIEIEAKKSATRLRVTGLGSRRAAGWLDARFTDLKFDVVGSLAAGRIQ
jgi:KaiC/GvpD/RAD55 family RecA-like ATPase